MTNMPAILSYIDHIPSPNTICTICLEPVAQKAIQVSCHVPLNCAECMNYWMEHQIGCMFRASCPTCRSIVDPSNLAAPRSSIEWKDIEEMGWDDQYEISESYFSDGENRMFDFDDEDTTMITMITAQTTPDEENPILEKSISDMEDNVDMSGETSNNEIDQNNNTDDEALASPSSFTVRACRTIRERYILRLSLSDDEIYQLYDRHQGPLPFNPDARNTYFAPGISQNVPIMICAEYQYLDTKDPLQYFFWVHEQTTIGKLTSMWAGNHSFENDCLIFEDKILSPTETVASCGLKDGSRFEIRRLADI